MRLSSIYVATLDATNNLHGVKLCLATKLQISLNVDPNLPSPLRLQNASNAIHR